jgi:anti-sigma factor RsiW
MSCEECGARLIDYHYGELSLEEQRCVAAHLTSCSFCALEYCRLHASLAGLTDWLSEEPPPALRDALRSRVEQTFRVPLWRTLARLFSVRIPLYQAALLLLLLLAGWVFLRDVPTLRGGQGDALAPRRAVTAGPARERTVLKGYDASRIVPLDPNVL